MSSSNFLPAELGDWMGFFNPDDPLSSPSSPISDADMSAQLQDMGLPDMPPPSSGGPPPLKEALPAGMDWDVAANGRSRPPADMSVLGPPPPSPPVPAGLMRSTRELRALAMDMDDAKRCAVREYFETLARAGRAAS